MTPKLTIDCITDQEGLGGLKVDYTRLSQSTGNTLPFPLYEWHVNWCSHYLNLNPHIHDHPRFHIVRDQAGICVAIVPLIVSRLKVGSFKVGVVNLLGADSGITEIRGPLVQSGYEEATARAVRGKLIDLQDWDWIQWTGISVGFADSLARGSNLQWRSSQCCHVLDLAPTWEELRARLKRNIRESLRHGYNSLKRDKHCFELQIAETPAAVRAALDRFFELHRMRAAMCGTVQHANQFASQVSQRFLYAVCEPLAAQRVVRIFQLRIGTAIVAIRIGFVIAGSLYLYYSGFDPRWAGYGVMTTLLAESIKYAISLGLKEVNLSIGTDRSKTRWGARAVEFKRAFEQRRRLRSSIFFKIYVSASSGSGVSAQLLHRLKEAR